MRTTPLCSRGNSKATVNRQNSIASRCISRRYIWRRGATNERSSVIPSEAEAATQRTKFARPGFQSRCETLGTSAGSLRLRYFPLKMTQGHELQAKNLAAEESPIPRQTRRLQGARYFAEHVVSRDARHPERESASCERGT